MSERKPVADWRTDWDHLDPAWRDDPYPIWAELRQRWPIAQTGRFEGAYLPTRYADVKAIAYDTEHFSARRVVVRDQYLDTLMPAPPITSDPPNHKPEKRSMLPFSTPRSMLKIEPKTRVICNDLIDGFIANGQCDAAQAYTRHIPVRVIAQMLGVDPADGDLLIKWITQILELGVSDDDSFVAGMTEMTHYFHAEVAKRQNNPTDDLIGEMMRAEFDGQPWEPERVIGALRLLMIAGIDTTWSGIGFCLWHLARYPEDCQRLRNVLQLMPLAIDDGCDRGMAKAHSIIRTYWPRDLVAGHGSRTTITTV